MTFEKIKILFIGTVNFSYESLSILLKHQFEVLGVVTKSKSNFNADFCDLTPLTIEKDIPVFYWSQETSEDLTSFVKSKDPDVIYCFGWSHILPACILSIPRYGVVGFHPAELPNNRGRHPIIWALCLGLEYTASTFFFMDEGADTGDIIAQEKIKIADDDAHSLYKKIIDVALKQILFFTQELESKKGIIERRSQNLSAGNSWRKRNKKDGLIDFRMSTDAIKNLVRALTYPYVGAHLDYLGEEIKIWKVKSELSNHKNIEPGKIIDIIESEIIVQAYDGAIRILKHEFKKMPLKGEYL